MLKVKYVCYIYCNFNMKKNKIKYNNLLFYKIILKNLGIYIKLWIVGCVIIDVIFEIRDIWYIFGFYLLIILKLKWVLKEKVYVG